MTTIVPPTPERTLGEKINDLVDQRAKYRVMKKKADELYEEYQKQCGEIMADMKTAKVEKATGTKGTVSLSSTDIAHVIEWDKVYNFILRSKSFELMQRRISDGAYRELLEKRKGKLLPGIKTFEKKGISLLETKKK